jgi:hypothetical protein
VVFSNFIGPASITPTLPITITLAWEDKDDDGVVDIFGIAEEELVVNWNGNPLTDTCDLEPGCDIEDNIFAFEVVTLGDFALVGPKTEFYVYLPLSRR